MTRAGVVRGADVALVQAYRAGDPAFGTGSAGGRSFGVGIKADQLTKVFDPFFTTREVGQGSGLGLSIARNVISNHGGSIEVESEEGKGSTFTIRLPVALCLTEAI